MTHSRRETLRLLVLLQLFLTLHLEHLRTYLFRNVAYVDSNRSLTQVSLPFDLDREEPVVLQLVIRVLTQSRCDTRVSSNRRLLLIESRALHLVDELLVRLRCLKLVFDDVT